MNVSRYWWCQQREDYNTTAEAVLSLVWVWNVLLLIISIIKSDLTWRQVQYIPTWDVIHARFTQRRLTLLEIIISVWWWWDCEGENKLFRAKMGKLLNDLWFVRNCITSKNAPEILVLKFKLLAYKLRQV